MKKYIYKCTDCGGEFIASWLMVECPKCNSTDETPKGNMIQIDQADLSIWFALGITIVIAVVMGIFATLKFWQVI